MAFLWRNENSSAINRSIKTKQKKSYMKQKLLTLPRKKTERQKDIFIYIYFISLFILHLFLATVLKALLKILMTKKSGGVAADNWTTLIFQDEVQVTVE